MRDPSLRPTNPRYKAPVLGQIFEANKESVGRAKRPGPTTQRQKGSGPKKRRANRAKSRRQTHQTAKKLQMK
jgi:hypothetical protein